MNWIMLYSSMNLKA